MTEESGAMHLGLSDEQEARARRLHADSIIVDLMFQGPCGYRVFSDEEVAKIVGLNALRVFEEVWTSAPGPSSAPGAGTGS